MKVTSDAQKSHKVVHSKIRIFDEPFLNLLNLILSCCDEIQKFVSSSVKITSDTQKLYKFVILKCIFAEHFLNLLNLILSNWVEIHLKSFSMKIPNLLGNSQFFCKNLCLGNSHAFL